MAVAVQLHEDQTGEVLMLEFQGSFTCLHAGGVPGPFSGAFLGELELEPKDGGRPRLIAPNQHIFLGKILKLQKPLLIATAVEDVAPFGGGKVSQKMEVKGVVRRKVIFKERPNVICVEAPEKKRRRLEAGE
mmetsp:Transcript_17267/g.38054  ORF Transcript_17267/g.38054 Transcript_17267/m.38054 type:complete len:132 (+) Transcript_17267:57-452(+)